MPLYIVIQACLLLGSAAACALMMGRGALLHTEERPVFEVSGGRTPFGSATDMSITFAGLLLFLVPQLALLRHAPAAESGDASLRHLIISMVFQSMVYIPFLLSYAALPRMAGYTPLSFRRMLLWVAAALGAIVIPASLLEYAGLYQWMAELTGCPVQQEVVDLMSNGSTEQTAVMILAAVVMAPLGEEAFFRGFLYNLMRRYNSVLPAALACGCFFGAVHGSLAQMLPLTLFGTVQCLVYERTRTLWVPVAVHAFFNGLSSLCILFSPYLPQ